MRTIRTLAIPVILLFLALTAVSAEAAAASRIDPWFIFGTNLAWFNSNYGCGIGVNHAEGSLQPTFSEQHCETIFANLEKMGCPLVRIWAFERQDGLMFSSARARAVGACATSSAVKRSSPFGESIGNIYSENRSRSVSHATF
ncbi:MAG: hypothetical protein BWY66_00067 [bacterium ADurb.Bin374]|nr:MAG: hypothetical protein BWY66_00067 [bacterium ADurb.Bin374]